MMPSYVWSLIYDHNNFVYVFIFVWSQAWTLYDSFSYLREVANLQALPQDTKVFFEKSTYISATVV